MQSQWALFAVCDPPNQARLAKKLQLTHTKMQNIRLVKFPQSLLF